MMTAWRTGSSIVVWPIWTYSATTPESRVLISAMSASGNAGRVVIGDQDRPQVLSAASSGTRVTIAFSEPMLEVGEGGGVTQMGNYRVDGADPLASDLACADRGCRTVIMTMRSALVAGRSYTLRVANAVDRAGRNITPDPTTLTFTAR